MITIGTARSENLSAAQKLRTASKGHPETHRRFLGPLRASGADPRAHLPLAEPREVLALVSADLHRRVSPALDVDATPRLLVDELCYLRSQLLSHADGHFLDAQHRLAE
jgi:hypothetical protein